MASRKRSASEEMWATFTKKAKTEKHHAAKPTPVAPTQGGTIRSNGFTFAEANTTTSLFRISGTQTKVSFDKLIENPKPVGHAYLWPAIRAAADRTPRFLFRVWCAASGGDARLNTPTAITPHAFIHPNQGPATIFHMSRNKISELAAGHFRGLTVNSVFSSWTHSLDFVFPFIMNRKTSAYTFHLSVIDTTLLPTHNIILHTPLMQVICDQIPSGAHEYLAFGTISRAHKAVPFTYPSPVNRSYNDQVDFAKKFGSHFELPVLTALRTAHVLSHMGHNVHPDDFLLGSLAMETVLETLRHYDIPEAWWADPLLTTDQAVTKWVKQYPDGWAWMEALKILVAESKERAAEERRQRELKEQEEEGRLALKRYLADSKERAARERRLRELEEEEEEGRLALKRYVPENEKRASEMMRQPKLAWEPAAEEGRLALVRKELDRIPRMLRELKIEMNY